VIYTRILLYRFNIIYIYMNNIKLFNNDCLEELKNIEDKSIDLIFVDLPYGQTSCKWDSLIDLELLWKQYKRIRKDTTPIIFTCSTKFGYSLIESNKKEFRYDLVWIKSSPVGFLNSKRMPMKKHEMVYVFYKKCPSEVYSNNIKKYHKHKYLDIERNTKDKNGNVYENDNNKKIMESKYEPSLPNSIIKEKKYDNTIYGDIDMKDFKGRNGKPRYNPPLPNSIIKDDNSYETESLYGKTIINDYTKCGRKDNGSAYNPPLPNSIIKEDIGQKGEVYGKLPKNGACERLYNPPLPNSIIKEDNLISITKNESKDSNTIYGELKIKPPITSGSRYEVPLPNSVIKENPQVVIESDSELYGKIKRTTFKNRQEPNYEPPLPNTILEIASQKKKHSTQKPTGLSDFFIKYYSNEGDIVLDNCMGSGSTGISCINLKRKFIGIEKDEEIFNLAKDRLEKELEKCK
jgi:DNA modification methylase